MQASRYHRREAYVSSFVLASVTIAFLFCLAPPASLAQIPPGNFQTIIPHSAFGGGFITRLFIVNLTKAANNLTINRISQNGTVVQSTQVTLQPSATQEMADSDQLRSQPLTIDWFAIASQGPITASVLFDFDGSSLSPPVNFRTAVGALASPPLTAFTTPVRVATVNVTVGIALANLSGSSTTINVKLLDQGGNVVAQDSVVLDPFAQTAFAVQDRVAFRNIVLAPSEFIGALEAITADATKPVAAIVVGNNLGQLFSLPVTAGVAK